MADHAFVVAAYGKSPYLADCLLSLSRQTSPSAITISTSTPFDGLERLAADFGAHLHVHGPNRGIGPDWNQALAATDASLVTIAHQDDVYDDGFSAQAKQAHARHADVAFSFCDADEILPDGSQRQSARNLQVKRLLVNAAYLGSTRLDGGFRRRILLGLGNPIICPTVTINRSIAPGFRFREDLKTNMDWLAWIDLSRKSGILHIPRTLMHRRVHEASETANCISDGARVVEDALVFGQLWPSPLASALARVYRLSYRGYMN